jgi:hypothetical protein
LVDGAVGESPVCTLKNATNRKRLLGDHVMAWRCDPYPPHEPEDKPTPPSKFYDLTERLGSFVLRDEEGGKRFLLVRDRKNKPIDLFELCEVQ